MVIGNTLATAVYAGLAAAANCAITGISPAERHRSPRLALGSLATSLTYSAIIGARALCFISIALIVATGYRLLSALAIVAEGATCTGATVTAATIVTALVAGTFRLANTDSVDTVMLVGTAAAVYPANFATFPAFGITGLRTIRQALSPRANLLGTTLTTLATATVIATILSAAIWLAFAFACNAFFPI